ncbi:hypothetical protein FA95DRAFT_1310078 [Auriscalpium vulgare]|uniref:Uncharacterized protein n=1 Tax=Auriscalpium vulgare TaxID=40419 RepID=A0ACB8RTA4_9AGAM|nr:hypothetical protein FA95DRAFT_1310078 [Auriscalpium vulgare]
MRHAGRTRSDAFSTRSRRVFQSLARGPSRLPPPCKPPPSLRACRPHVLGPGVACGSARRRRRRVAGHSARAPVLSFWEQHWDHRGLSGSHVSSGARALSCTSGCTSRNGARAVSYRLILASVRRPWDWLPRFFNSFVPIAPLLTDKLSLRYQGLH